MIDFHSHLDLYPNAPSLLPRVAKQNIFTLVVSTSPRAWLATSRVFAGYPNIKVALGLHPEIAVAKAAEMDLLVGLVAQAEFIGEIGLDGSPRFKHSLALQRRILDVVLAECERVGGRVMSLHSRGAADQVLDALEAHPKAGTPVFHWFSGTKKQLRRAVDQGAWFSVGPSMVASEKGRQLVSEMPAANVLLETDGPFATKADGTPWFPWETGQAAQALCDLWRMPVERVRAQLVSNLKTIVPGLSTADGIE
ncbi:Qat anti-phage system TatD family nuclease QatD [Acidovorax sp. NCPPB 4044]|uniref:Qat anti-phage system TatD family nuclease QatD n=1 Tax=Acidovorax sp. NCPPB 4044 TaxID=2940490 RepID=UPI002303A75E|nr:Qat anti-phage system TatD family nuclease QatD [Acidovorax sp. NCPPB 4044]MDA8520529.1 TatD family hydrolase [Acidovorax sp. NCPPB 4044]